MYKTNLNKYVFMTQYKNNRPKAIEDKSQCHF